MRIAKLGAEEWVEIFYALELKVTQIERGEYDDERGEVSRRGSETAKWATHLRSIMIKIASD